MVKLIMGLRGSGKTKTLVSMVNDAVANSKGNVVCIEKDHDLTYDIPIQARLIHAGEYDINSNDKLMGFVFGLHAGNYDITHIFIDNFYKMLSDSSNETVEKLLATLSAFGEANGVTITITASADPANASEGVKKYF